MVQFSKNVAPFQFHGRNTATNVMKILQARRRRHVLKTCLISCIHQRRQTLLKISAPLMLLLTSTQSTNAYRKLRLCRRLIRNIGWWDYYSVARFRKTFRASRETFMYILSFIRNDLDLPRKLIK